MARIQHSAWMSTDPFSRAKAQAARWGDEASRPALSHAQINAQLGNEGACTAAVDGFIDRALAAPARPAR